MGFLKKVFCTEDNTIAITSPLSGMCISVHNVNDPTFATDILGKGVAVIPSDGKIYAPDSGTVTSVFPTGHAVCLMLDSGVELLIHIGIDTVELNGFCFTKHVEAEQHVNKGDLLIEVDIDGVSKAGYDIVTPVIINNTDEFKSVEVQTGPVEVLETIVMTVTRNR